VPGDAEQVEQHGEVPALDQPEEQRIEAGEQLEQHHAEHERRHHREREQEAPQQLPAGAGVFEPVPEQREVRPHVAPHPHDPPEPVDAEGEDRQDQVADVDAEQVARAAVPGERRTGSGRVGDGAGPWHRAGGGVAGRADFDRLAHADARPRRRRTHILARRRVAAAPRPARRGTGRR
jgi:hypothetical protein